MKALLLTLCLLIVPPAYAQKVELKPAITLDKSKFQEDGFRDLHPKVYKYSSPLRATGRFLHAAGRKSGINATLKVMGDGAVWIGKKSERYQPFMNLATSATNAAVSTGVWFRR